MNDEIVIHVSLVDPRTGESFVGSKTLTQRELVMVNHYLTKAVSRAIEELAGDLVDDYVTYKVTNQEESSSHNE